MNCYKESYIQIWKKRKINLQVYSNGVKLYFKILIYANWSIAPLSIKSLLKGELSKTCSKTSSQYIRDYQIWTQSEKKSENEYLTGMTFEDFANSRGWECQGHHFSISCLLLLARMQVIWYWSSSRLGPNFSLGTFHLGRKSELN